MSTRIFWLPCGRVNFFHLATDADLLEKFSPRGNVEPVARSWTVGPNEDFPVTGSSSLFRRLLVQAVSKAGAGPVVATIDREDEPTSLTIDWGDGTTCQVTADGLHRWSNSCANREDPTLDDRIVNAVDLPATVWEQLDSGSASATGATDNGNVWLGDYPSYLCFFQLNLLIGGLANRNLEPGTFLELTTAPIDDSWTGLESILRDVWLTERPEHVHDDHLDRAVARFLHLAQERCLRKLKWRVERARRALLTSMLGIVHRKSPMVQLREELPAHEDFRRANEGQLRGYIMLASAKLPLIEAIGRYAEEAVTEEAFDHKEGRQMLRSWDRLIEIIEDNVKGLETALHHAWMERLLYEQEQSRAEQEALAEIERSRVRTQTATTTVDSVFGASVLIVTIATFFAAGVKSDPVDLAKEVIFVGSGLAIAVVIWGSFRLYLWNRRRQIGEQRHSYEFNLRLDSPMEADSVGRLMSLGSPVQGPLGNPRIELPGQRGSVRVERMTDDDALFKLHIDSAFRVPADPATGSPSRRLETHAVFEILFHQPGSTGAYVLREVRVMTHAKALLSASQLRWYSEQLAREMVDPYLTPPESMLERVLAQAEPSTAPFTRSQRLPAAAG